MIRRDTAVRIYAFLSRYAPPLVPVARIVYYGIADRDRLRHGIAGNKRSREIRKLLRKLQDLAAMPGALSRSYSFDQNGELYVGSAYGVQFAFIDGFGLRYLELNGTNDRAQVEFALRNLSDDAVVIDVGASYGYYSATIAVMKRNSRVFAFEPSTFFYSYLVKNLERNGVADRVVALNAAVGKEEGKGCAAVSGTNVEFVRFPAAESQTKIQPGGIEVDIQSIDSLVAQHNLGRLDYIKADVEGAELFVVQGGIDSIRRFRPIVQLELTETFATTRFGYSILDIFKIFEKLDYSYLLLPHSQSATENGPLQRASNVRKDISAAMDFFFVPRERNISIDLAEGVPAVPYPYVTLRLDKRSAD